MFEGGCVVLFGDVNGVLLTSRNWCEKLLTNKKWHLDITRKAGNCGGHFLAVFKKCQESYIFWRLM